MLNTNIKKIVSFCIAMLLLLFLLPVKTNAVEPVSYTPQLENIVFDTSRIDDFTFSLTAVSNAPMPAGSSESVKEITLSGSSDGDFGEIVFNMPSVHTYIVKQTSKNENYNYDTSVYYLMLYVGWSDESMSALSVKAVVSKDGKPGKYSSLEFHNSFSAGGSGGGEAIRKNIRVKKIWVEPSGSVLPEHDEITVHLLRNGVRVGTAKLNGSGSSPWEHVFFNMLQLGTYTLEEEPVEGYTTSISGIGTNNTFTITNTRKTQNEVTNTTKIKVKKIWSNEQNREKRPERIEISLLNKQTKKTITHELTGSKNEDLWTYEFTDLPVGDYTVSEGAVAGYTASYAMDGGDVNTIVITNTAINKTSVGVVKLWDDNNNASGQRPGDITIELFKDNERQAYKTKTITGHDNANSWRCVFDDLPQNSTYAVREVENSQDYTVSYASDGYGDFLITNTLKNKPDEPNKPQDPDDKPQDPDDKPQDPGDKPDDTTPSNPHNTDIIVKKVWEDKNNSLKLRPDSVSLHLIENGVTIQTIALTAGSNWSGRFTDVAVNKFYSIIESAVDNYSTQYHGSATYGFAVYNVCTPGITDGGTPPEPTSPLAFGEIGGGMTEVSGSGSGFIPQTGLLWWPVPVMLILGILMILYGAINLIKTRRKTR